MEGRVPGEGVMQAPMSRDLRQTITKLRTLLQIEFGDEHEFTIVGHGRLVATSHLSHVTIVPREDDQS